MILRKLPLHSPHVASLLIILATLIALEAEEHFRLYPQKWNPSLLFQLLYHSGVLASLCLCFSIPSTLTLPLYICFSLLVASTRSWLLLSHDCCLLPLPWVTPSVSAPAYSVFGIWSPWKDLLRVHGHAPVKSSCIWQASPAWCPQRLLALFPCNLLRKALGPEADPWALSPQ